jgi:hypothetical protein
LTAVHGVHYMPFNPDIAPHRFESDSSGLE